MKRINQPETNKVGITSDNETSLAKIGSSINIDETVVRKQLNNLSMVGQNTQQILPKSVASMVVSSDGIQTPVCSQGLQQENYTIPVIRNGSPLMPTTASRARRWIKTGKATGFWKNGIFCVRLNKEPSNIIKQQIALGIDPGSKREGFTVKSKRRTYINILADARNCVKESVKTRSIMRRSRRNRNTPCRKPRFNRARGGIPPSTKARWDWKLRIIKLLMKLYPITDIVVEDIKAKTKSKRKWDVMFSPLEVGKQWFYNEIEQLNIKLHLMQGYETKELRDKLGLKKTSKKMAEVFESHNVDSFVLAFGVVGGFIPDNKRIIRMSPLQFHRRQLHKLQPEKGGIRRREGGTISLGLKRGSIIKHNKYGICYVGGNIKNRISLHSIETGKRSTQSAKLEDVKFLSYSSSRVWTPTLGLKTGASLKR